MPTTNSFWSAPKTYEQRKQAVIAKLDPEILKQVYPIATQEKVGGAYFCFFEVTPEHLVEPPQQISLLLVLEAFVKLPKEKQNGKLLETVTNLARTNPIDRIYSPDSRVNAFAALPKSCHDPLTSASGELFIQFLTCRWEIIGTAFDPSDSSKIFRASRVNPNEHIQLASMYIKKVEEMYAKLDCLDFTPVARIFELAYMKMKPTMDDMKKLCDPKKPLALIEQDYIKRSWYPGEVAVPTKYSRIYNGQATIYSSLFAETKAWIKGERELFANTRTWWAYRNHESYRHKPMLFANTRAFLEGKRELFANTRAAYRAYKSPNVIS